MIQTLATSESISPALAALGYGPGEDGWHRRSAPRTGHFDDIFAGIRLRRESAEQVRLRLVPDSVAKNLNGVIHGGFLLALVDHALFAVPIGSGRGNAVGGSTIETSTQFYAPALADRPIDIVGSVMRETGRMIFTRGVIEQDGKAVAGFAGTVRKIASAASAARIDEFLKVRLQHASPSGHDIE